jgi:hypothetical protein
MHHESIESTTAKEEEALRGIGLDLWPRLRRIAVEVHGSDALRKLKERICKWWLWGPNLR